MALVRRLSGLDIDVPVVGPSHFEKLISLLQQLDLIIVIPIKDFPLSVDQLRHIPQILRIHVLEILLLETRLVLAGVSPHLDEPLHVVALLLLGVEPINFRFESI